MFLNNFMDVLKLGISSLLILHLFVQKRISLVFCGFMFDLSSHQFPISFRLPHHLTEDVSLFPLINIVRSLYSTAGFHCLGFLVGFQSPCSILWEIFVDILSLQWLVLFRWIISFINISEAHVFSGFGTLCASRAK